MKTLIAILLIIAPMHVLAEGCYVDFSDPLSCSGRQISCSESFPATKAEHGGQIASLCVDLQEMTNLRNGLIRRVNQEYSRYVQTLNNYNGCARDYTRVYYFYRKRGRKIHRLKRLIKQLKR